MNVPLNIDWHQILMHLFNFALLAGGLYLLLYQPVKRFMEKRAAHYKEMDDAANEKLEHAKALEAMDMLGVAKLAEQDIMTMSSGQARRVLFARALVHDPSTLLLDEPCTGLDPEGMYYVRSSMRDLAKAGKGIVLITHYPEDIIPEIKRLVLVKEGKLFADGAKEDMLTDQMMSSLFGVPLQVAKNGKNNEYFSLVSSY